MHTLNRAAFFWQAVIQNPDLVVAIDVGSTYSGYAWQYRSDFLKNRSNVEFNLLWGEGSPQVINRNILLIKLLVPDAFASPTHPAKQTINK